MQFNIITLFPDWIHQYCTTNIVGRAQANGIIKVQTVNPRDFTTDVHHKVDDTPYGGGAGMVMMCKPLMDAYESLLPLAQDAAVILTSPVGQPFTQAKARQLAQCSQVIILCGHYEGVDARIEQLIPNLQRVSIGDFVLTGGELAALCILDATTRLLPGALGKEASLEEESFTNGLLEYPHYTRPPEFRGIAVPPVLLSGHHAEIERWRRQMALWNTYRFRPDLLAQAPLTQADREFLASLETAPNPSHSLEL